MNENTFSLSGQIVDLIHSRIFPGRITVNDNIISEIEELPKAEMRFILPGFIDAHDIFLQSLCFLISYMMIAAALEAFSELIFPTIGMDTTKSHFSLTSLLTQKPSEPMTTAILPETSVL